MVWPTSLSSFVFRFFDSFLESEEKRQAWVGGLSSLRAGGGRQYLGACLSFLEQEREWLVVGRAVR